MTKDLKFDPFEFYNWKFPKSLPEQNKYERRSHIDHKVLKTA